MGKLKQLESIKDKHITEEFLNNKDIQSIAGQVSDYAKESPLEFVAETFAYKMLGKTFSKEVEELYIKYGGPVLA